MQTALCLLGGTCVFFVMWKYWSAASSEEHHVEAVGRFLWTPSNEEVLKLIRESPNLQPPKGDPNPDQRHEQSEKQILYNKPFVQAPKIVGNQGMMGLPKLNQIAVDNKVSVYPPNGDLNMPEQHLKQLQSQQKIVKQADSELNKLTLMPAQVAPINNNRFQRDLQLFSQWEKDRVITSTAFPLVGLGLLHDKSHQRGLGPMQDEPQENINPAMPTESSRGKMGPLQVRLPQQGVMGVLQAEPFQRGLSPLQAESLQERLGRGQMRFENPQVDLSPMRIESPQKEFISLKIKPNEENVRHNATLQSDLEQLTTGLSQTSSEQLPRQDRLLQNLLPLTNESSQKGQFSSQDTSWQKDPMPRIQGAPQDLLTSYPFNKKQQPQSDLLKFQAINFFPDNHALADDKKLAEQKLFRAQHVFTKRSKQNLQNVRDARKGKLIEQQMSNS